MKKLYSEKWNNKTTKEAQNPIEPFIRQPTCQWPSASCHDYHPLPIAAKSSSCHQRIITRHSPLLIHLITEFQRAASRQALLHPSFSFQNFVLILWSSSKLQQWLRGSVAVYQTMKPKMEVLEVCRPYRYPQHQEPKSHRLHEMRSCLWKLWLQKENFINKFSSGPRIKYIISTWWAIYFIESPLLCNFSFDDDEDDDYDDDATAAKPSRLRNQKPSTSEKEKESEDWKVQLIPQDLRERLTFQWREG